MDLLDQAQVQAIEKLSTSRLISKLLQVGYTEDGLDSMNRDTMLDCDGKTPRNSAEFYRPILGNDTDSTKLALITQGSLPESSIAIMQAISAD